VLEITRVPVATAAAPDVLHTGVIPHFSLSRSFHANLPVKFDLITS